MANENQVESLIAGSEEIDRMRARIGTVHRIILGALKQVGTPKRIDIPLGNIRGQAAKLIIDVKGFDLEPDLRLTVGSTNLSKGSLPAQYVPEVYAQLDTILARVVHDGAEAGNTLNFLIATGERKLATPEVRVIEL